MKVTPHRVSGRVVKISRGSPASVWKTTCAPSERPIQRDCRVRTRSGQSMPEVSSSSSAYRVVRKNHCDSSLRMTGVSHRSQTRSSPTTCSRASVVLQLGHQSTAAFLR